MIVTPHDFHHKTDLRCDGALINLEGELGIQLDMDLLRGRYITDAIRYFDIESNYNPLPQVTADNQTWMAIAFFPYLLGAYLFANRGQMASLRWLALFRNFGKAREANQRQAYLIYLYFSLDTLSRGTLRQLVGPWKLLKVSSLFFFFCSSCISPLLQLFSSICHLGLKKIVIMLLQTESMHLSSKLSSCNLLTSIPYKLQLLFLSSCKLCFFYIAGLCNMVSLLKEWRQISRASLWLGLTSMGCLLMR